MILGVGSKSAFVESEILDCPTEHLTPEFPLNTSYPTHKVRNSGRFMSQCLKSF